ncbi:MAG: O-antigen ligase family protein [Nocardioidaceae bacterium]
MSTQLRPEAAPAGSQAAGPLRSRLPWQRIALGLAVLTGLLTAVSPLLGVAVAAVMVVLVVLARWRDAIPVLTIAVIYSNAVVIFAQQGTVPTAASGVLLAALGLTVLRRALDSGTVAVRPPGFAPVLAFAGVQCISALFSVAPEVAQADVISSLSEGTLLYVLVVYAVVETRTIMSVVNALLVVAAGLGALSLTQFLLGDYTNTFFGFAGVSNAVVPGSTAGTDLQQLRVNGNIGETNRYGQVLAVLLPLAVVRFAATSSRAMKVFAVASAVLMLCGIVLTYSRGTAVALVAILVTATLLRWMRARWLAGAVAVAAVIALTAPGYAERLDSLTTVAGVTELQGSSTAADNAVRGRATEIVSAVLAFADHPVLGVGPGAFPTVSPQYAATVGIRPRLEERESHNLYAGTAAETGILGLTAFLLVLVQVVAGCAKAVRRWAAVDRTRALLARGFLAAVLVYAYSGMFLHLSYVRYFWLLIALAAATARLPGEQTRPIGRSWRRAPADASVHA